jgi:hypothetical protein
MIEYLVEELGNAHTAARVSQQAARLAELGADNWRLVSVSGTIGYFVRDPEPEPAEPPASGEHRERRRR